MKPTILQIAPIAAAAALGLALAAGCAHVKVDPIEVKEIHIVHDVNIRVDKQLDEFFAFQDQHPSTTQATTAPAPATATTQASAGDVQ